MVASRLLLSFRAYILIPVAQMTMIRAVLALEYAGGASSASAAAVAAVSACVFFLFLLILTRL